MEITAELLLTIRKRVEQVFFAKQNHKVETIEMDHDGNFNCNYSYAISYGGTEYEHEFITAEDLTSNLDDLVKIREAKEKIEREEQDKRQIEINERYKREQKEKRLAEYNKLKQEFDDK